MQKTQAFLSIFPKCCSGCAANKSWQNWAITIVFLILERKVVIHEHAWGRQGQQSLCEKILTQTRQERETTENSRFRAVTQPRSNCAIREWYARDSCFCASGKTSAIYLWRYPVECMNPYLKKMQLSWQNNASSFFKVTQPEYMYSCIVLNKKHFHM